MGAWGHKVFEDDSALDALEDLMEAESVAEEMARYFGQALEAEYLEYDDAHYALVSAAILDGVLSGENYFDADEEEYGEWMAGLSKKELTPLKAEAVRAIARVLADESELKELWEENEAEFEAWRQDKLAIQKRLNG